MAVERENLERGIAKSLSASIHGCDLLVNFFGVALFSYRKSNVCDPFPEFFCQGNVKDFEQAQRCYNLIPALNSLQCLPDGRLSGLADVPEAAVRLLHWIVCPVNFSVRRCTVEEYLGDRSSHPNKQTAQKSEHIFELVYTTPLDARNLQRTVGPFHDAEKFDELSAEYSTVYGFHGSPLENWHRILRRGLDYERTSDQSMYGRGIYLATDQRVSEAFIQYGQTWDRSVLPAAKISCIAGCLVANRRHDGAVRVVAADVRHTASAARAALGTSVPSAASAAQGQQLRPDEYLVVTANEYVQIKHLLVFESGQRPRPGAAGRGVWAGGLSRGTWLLIFYVALLFLIPIIKNINTRNFGRGWTTAY